MVACNSHARPCVHGSVWFAGGGSVAGASAQNAITLTCKDSEGGPAVGVEIRDVSLRVLLPTAAGVASPTPGVCALLF